MSAQSAVDTDPMDLRGRMGALVDAVASYHPKADTRKLWDAFELGLQAHEGQLRKSGEPYFVHPISVAEALCDLRLDVDTIVAGLLHDVVPQGAGNAEQASGLVEGRIRPVVPD